MNSMSLAIILSLSLTCVIAAAVLWMRQHTIERIQNERDTERKEAKAKLKEARRTLSGVEDFARGIALLGKADGILFGDPKGIRFSDGRLEEKLGYDRDSEDSPSPLLGDGWLSIIHPDDVDNTLSTVLASPKRGSVVNRYMTTGGRPVWIEWTWRRISEETVVNTWRDISAEKLAERLDAHIAEASTHDA